MSAKLGTGRAWRPIKGLMYAALAVIVIVVVVEISGVGAPSHKPDKGAQVSSVKLGMIEPQVRQILGDPDSTQHSETDGMRHDTWHYTKLATGSDYRLVFKNGRLTKKART